MSTDLTEWGINVSPLISAVTAFAVIVIGLRVVKIIFTNGSAHKDSTHNWKTTSAFQGASCCNSCKRLIIEGEGKYCDCCGIYADLSCVPGLNKKTPCKAISIPSNDPMKHHWVRGNLKPLSICDVCDKECYLSTELKHYKCCWCLKAVHQKCKLHVAEVCDFGPYRSLIIPPTSVELFSKRGSVRRFIMLKEIKQVDWPNWTPLLILANCKSGSNEGEEILSKFRGLLNPGQVIDLGRRRPEVALEWCMMLGDTPCKILVAGGDGTVGWVLNTIVKLKPTAEPAVGIIPLGTGNDMSRVLGWGKSTTSSLVATSLLNAVLHAEPVLFDRWKVEIKPQRSLRLHSSSRELFMYNYFSIGVDAQVTLDFHHARESPFYIYSSRIINKLLYLGYGTQQMIEKKCQGLNEKIELYLDGAKVDLPAIESIVVLNIDSWGAGVNLWKMSKTEENEVDQSYNDRLLEVLGIYSSLHIAQLQVGLGVPHRVGQARNIKIKLNSSCAVQVDGEPWLQQPATFQITHFNQAVMLRKV